MSDCEEHTALKGLEKKLFKLVSKGATKDQWAQWLRAPLEHALAEGDKSLALALLKAGADAGAGWEGCDGRTLLGAAAEGGNHEMVSAVLEAGGLEDLNTISGENNMTAVLHAIAGGHTDAARVLMLSGADMRLLDGRGRSALHYAVEGGHLQLAEDTILAGADLGAGDIDGDTPLHLAAAHDDHAFVGTLLRRGASVSATNKKGQHPLHVAVQHGHIAVTEALLKAGADLNAFCDDGSPLYLAHGNLEMTRTFLKNGIDVKKANGRGFTGLHFAGVVDGADVIEALVEAGADVEANSAFCTHPIRGEYKQLTPLHVSALFCNTEGTSALLRAGAEVNAFNEDGRTPLHLVCDKSVEHVELFQDQLVEAADVLLRGGAYETITDNHGRTPAQLIEQTRATTPLRRLLANAPADRAWRRRGMLVMCRAFPEKITTKGGKGRANKGKVKAHRGRGRGGGSAGCVRGRGNMMIRLVEMEDDAIFRTIIGFL